jgi:hypothetical protein
VKKILFEWFFLFKSCWFLLSSSYVLWLLQNSSVLVFDFHEVREGFLLVVRKLKKRNIVITTTLAHWENRFCALAFLFEAHNQFRRVIITNHVQSRSASIWARLFTSKSSYSSLLNHIAEIFKDAIWNLLESLQLGCHFLICSSSNIKYIFHISFSLFLVVSIVANNVCDSHVVELEWAVARSHACLIHIHVFHYSAIITSGSTGGVTSLIELQEWN